MWPMLVFANVCAAGLSFYFGNEFTAWINIAVAAFGISVQLDGITIQLRGIKNDKRSEFGGIDRG